MKKTYLILAAFALLTGMTLMNSCKKDDNQVTDTAVLNQEQSSDEEDVAASTDNVDDDIDIIMSASTLKSTNVNLPCNSTIDSSQIANKKLSITFKGDNCRGSRTRSGKVEVTLTNGTKWQDVGAVLTIKYTDLTITNKKGRSIVINGTKTHTNVSGGLVKNLGLAGTPATIIRKIESSDMKVTFPNNTARTWNIARQRTFTKVNGNTIITVTGFGSADGKSNLVVWGSNRRATNFYTQINTPVVMSSECDYNPSSGAKVHYVGLRTVNVTLGTDVNGVPVTEGCADYYKISWEAVGGTKTVILPY